MRNMRLTVPTIRQRNPVAAALARLATRAKRHKEQSRTPQKDRRDLADRVRECGEW